EDWSRLRDAVGDQGSDEEYQFLIEPAAEPADDEPLLGHAPAQTEGAAPDRSAGPEAGRHELTIEDLKKSPPEYVDLPRSEARHQGEEPVEPTAEPPGGEAGVSEADASEPETPWEPVPSNDEPRFADVEAA